MISAHATDASKMIWIVDDSPLDAERARRALADRYAVKVFCDGSAALEALANEAPPDVLVLDWVMPGMSGIDVCHFLRNSSPALSNIGILLLTARQQTTQLVEGLAAGANDYVAKPYADEELLARVGALIRSSELLKRTESAEAAVRHLLLNLPDALLVLNRNGRLLCANPEATRALDQPLDELVGLPIDQILPEIPLELLTAASTGDHALPLPDVTIGQEIYAPTARSFHLHHLNDRHHGDEIVVVLRCVTHRRRAEARRLDFYSIIAHDLRSPLHAMLMRSEVILRGKRGEIPPNVAQDLLKMQCSIRSLVAMINDFLDLASLEGGAYKLKTEEIDLVSLTLAAADDIRPLAHAGELTLEVASDTRPVMVADRRRLMQVLGNLLSNAIKFTPRRGAVTVSFTETDEFVEVGVQDTGIGIAPEHLTELFQRYWRPSTMGGVLGTGLGLMIVREVVEAHGGTVGVESTIGEGSRFWFRLPRPRRRVEGRPLLRKAS
ncbi:MAG: response regulator [Polyangiaceae bacterium]|nr:response regulator [Polyangiaceae bacterium]